MALIPIILFALCVLAVLIWMIPLVCDAYDAALEDIHPLKRAMRIVFFWALGGVVGAYVGATTAVLMALWRWVSP